MAYPNYVYSIFSFVGFLMCAIPFPWHLEAWNTGTCLYMFWVGIGCLNSFINSIVWTGNAINWAPVWCDISAKFIIGIGYGIPAATLCINRRLYRIASVKSVTISKAEKRRAVYVDLAIGVVIPIIGMILHYVVQGHRFNIFEDIGCFPYTYPSIPTFFIMYAPTLSMGLISGYYAVRSIIEFKRSRQQFNEFLSSHANLTSDRYLRLMLLAGVEVLCNVPLSIYFVVVNTLGTIRPYTSWDDVHWGFSRVDQFASVLWRMDTRDELALEATRWLLVVCAFTFFIFFGFADEARKNYRTAFTSIAKKMGISTVGWASQSSTGAGSSKTGEKSGSASGGKWWFGGRSSSGAAGSKLDASRNSGSKARSPILVHKEMLQRRDSLDSFGMDVSINDVGGLLGSGASIDEKKATSTIASFSPTQSYGGLTLNDVGGTLEVKDDILATSPVDTLVVSTPVSPGARRSRASSFASARTSPEPVEMAHTHDVV